MEEYKDIKNDALDVYYVQQNHLNYSSGKTRPNRVNCTLTGDKGRKKSVGKPRSSQNYQQKRSKTVEDETRNVYDNQGKKNCGSSFQADSSAGTLSLEKKDAKIETDHYVGG